MASTPGEFQVGDVVKVEGAVTKLSSSGDVVRVLISKTGRELSFLPNHLTLVSRPEPAEPGVGAVIELFYANSSVTTAAVNVGLSPTYSGRTWSVTGTSGRYSWRGLLATYGPKFTVLREGKPEPVITTGPGWAPNKPEPEPTGPYAYLDEYGNIHERDALCPSLYCWADDTEQRLTVTELTKRQGPLKALYLEGEI